ncbi:transposase [Bacteroidia bacterium]|nr:transposase [Bacteroidia bacterium]
MRSSFKILFYLKKNSPKPDGTVPVMGRITIDGTISQFSCKINVPVNLWDTRAGRLTGKSALAIKANLALDKIRVDINRHYQEVMHADGFVTADKVKNAYLGLGVKQDTFLSLFEKHNREFSRKVGYNRAKASYAKYCTIYMHMGNYIRQEYNRSDIFLKELNLAFINGFEHYLRTERSCSTNTIWLYMIGVKHIVAIARNSGQLAINPFAGYLISPEHRDRGFLTKDELNLLVNARMKNAQYELVRDLFVFSCFCGLSYSDVKNLTKDNFKTSFDGHLWIITRRQKTNTDSSIRLLEVPKRIIEKYRGYSRDNRLFPVPSNSACNNILKQIAKQCGIKTRLTYHVARHTFGTLLTISQGVPIETVSRMMGHTNIKTTQIYAKITKEKISQDMEILSRKLESLEKQITERI